MAKLQRVDSKAAENTMVFAEGTGEAKTVKLGEGTVRFVTFGPGWRWSKHVGPVVGAERCQTAHMPYVVAGRHHVVMDDGSEIDLGPGDAAVIPPGHDAWTIGDEPCVLVDFGGMRA